MPFTTFITPRSSTSSMLTPQKFIWMDGKLIKWKDAKVHILTHTLHYGGGVFEGIRCYQTKNSSAIFRLNDHINRLFESAKFMHMKIPFSKSILKEAIIKLIQANKIKEAYIRPIVYYGYGVMGLNPRGAPVNVAIACWPWGAYLGEKGLKQGISAKIVHNRRYNGKHNEAKICGNYFNSILAKQESLHNHADEAILLDEEKFVAEGSGENIFIVKNKTIITPKPGAILLGITRKSIIEIGRRAKMNVLEKQISVKELLSADECFFTGTAAELTPVTKINGRHIGKGIPGPITNFLQAEFNRALHGTSQLSKKWVTYV